MLNGPNSSEGETPLRMLVQNLLDTVKLGVTVRVVRLLPGLGPLRGDLMVGEDLTETLPSHLHRPGVVISEILPKNSRTWLLGRTSY